MTDDKDLMILSVIRKNKAIDLKAIRDIIWRDIDEDKVGDLNIGERITRLYLKEYIRKAPNYDGYHITRKGKRVLEQVLVD
jgi:hypothetical protein